LSAVEKGTSVSRTLEIKGTKKGSMSRERQRGTKKEIREKNVERSPWRMWARTGVKSSKIQISRGQTLPKCCLKGTRKANRRGGSESRPCVRRPREEGGRRLRATEEVPTFKKLGERGILVLEKHYKHWGGRSVSYERGLGQELL